MSSIHIFENIPDPRAENPNKLYSVAQIVFQTIAAVSSGCEHWTEIEDFGEDKKEWIGKYVQVGEGVGQIAQFKDKVLNVGYNKRG